MDGSEGIVVAHPEERHELVVAAQPQQRTVRRDASETRRCVEC
jgi:hypothetical protein